MTPIAKPITEIHPKDGSSFCCGLCGSHPPLSFLLGPRSCARSNMVDSINESSRPRYPNKSPPAGLLAKILRREWRKHHIDIVESALTAEIRTKAWLQCYSSGNGVIQTAGIQLVEHRNDPLGISGFQKRIKSHCHFRITPLMEHAIR
ncbi:hypothetical protein [Rhizobium sp. ZPR3]|uniref:Uncharacterized protein n=2 Tax=unclassified Rhizobium TaxID=2613769 RepID=A0AAU7SJR1_9HYPH